MTGQQRAERILRRALALFEEHTGEKMACPGTLLSSWAGLTVALAVKDKRHAELTIIDQQQKHDSTTLAPVFAAHIVANGPATVKTWEGGGWERRFTAVDA